MGMWEKGRVLELFCPDCRSDARRVRRKAWYDKHGVSPPSPHVGHEASLRNGGEESDGLFPTSEWRVRGQQRKRAGMKTAPETYMAALKY